MRAFRQLHFAHPQDADVSNNFVYFAALTGHDGPLAERLAAENLARDPQNLTCLATRAFVVFMDGRAADALALLQPWATEVENSPALAYAYGLAMAGTGNKAEARTLLGRCNQAALTAREVDAHADHVADLPPNAKRLVERVGGGFVAPGVALDEPQVVQAERHACAITELATQRKRAQRVLERERIVPAHPVQLADVVERARDARLVLGLTEERERRRKMAARVVKVARLPSQAPDPRVRGSADASQIEPPGPPKNLGKRAKGGVVATRELEHLSVVVHGPQAQVFVGMIALVEEMQALREELCGLCHRKARPRDLPGADGRSRRESDRARALAVSREHLEVLLAARSLPSKAEPRGDGAVVPARRGGRRQAFERLPLEIVLEYELLVAAKGAVGQTEHVVAVDQLGETLAQRGHVGGLTALPNVGGSLELAMNGHQPAKPEDAAHGGRALEDLALVGRKGGNARLNRVLYGQG